MLLLAGVIYAGWYYLSAATNRPIRVPLIADSRVAISKVIVGSRSPEFQLERGDVTDTGEDRWVVSRKQKLLYGQDGRIRRLLEDLTTAVSDSLVTGSPNRTLERRVVELRGPGYREVFTFYFGQDPAGAVFVQFDGAGATLALPATANRWLREYFTFDAYREPRLLNVSPEAVDSIFVMRRDSILWGITAGDMRQAAQRFIASNTAAYADHFDEIAHQDRAFATIELYTQGTPRQIQVFRDSLWPQPYVLVGEDYPRRSLGYASLR